MSHARSGRLPRPVIALIAAALVAALTAAAVHSLPTGAPPLAVLPLPEPLSAQAAWLPDGTPILLARDRYGEKAVHVVQARVPWGPIDSALRWCRTTPGFEDAWLGASFRNDGTWTGGPVFAEPVSHQVRVQGGRVLVGAARPAEPRSPGNPPPRGGAVCFPGPGERSPDAVDHGWSRMPALSVAAVYQGEHWKPVLVRGILVQDENGDTRLCEAIDPGALTCEGAALFLGRRADPYPGRFALDVLVWGRVRGGHMHRGLLTTVLAERGYVEVPDA